MNIMRPALQLLLSAAVSVGYTTAQLSFTAIPDQQESSLLARANAVTAYLENYIQQTCGANVSVSYNPVNNYDDAVSALLEGVADFGWYGGLTGVQAGLRSPPAVYVAQRVEDKQFTSVFIQAEGMNMTDGIEGAQGMTLSYGSESSTSGHLMPAYYLGEAGVTTKSTFTGSHDKTIDAVINGDTQIGALNSIVWKRRVDAGTVNGTTVFYTTPEYVDYLWVSGSGIADTWASIEGAASNADCEDVNTLLTNAFVSADATVDPLARALFDAYSTVGYVAITEGEYDPIEETGCALGMIEEKYCDEPIPTNLGNVGNATPGKVSVGDSTPPKVTTEPAPPADGSTNAPTAIPVDNAPAPTEKPVASSAGIKYLGVVFITAHAVAIFFQ